MRGFVPALRPRLKPLLMALHWTVPVLIVGALGRPAPGWGLALAASAMLWLALSVLVGLNRPGPALTGWLRPLHFWSHVALLALLTLATAALVADHPQARRLLLVTFMLGLLHGIFHLWRHTVLGDGALRNMLPKATHKIL